MIGFGKHKLYTKFEIASFSRCINIKGKSLNFRKLPWPKATTTSSSGGIRLWNLTNPSYLPNLKSLDPEIVDFMRCCLLLSHIERLMTTL